MELVIKGAVVSGGLIMAIGSQNAFVLKQGLLKNNVLAVALTCFLCDALLMTIGVLGLGSAISESKLFSLLLATFGALFLFWYGARSFFSALRSSNFLNEGTAESTKPGVKSTIASTLAITLLNPHVYLDTVVIVGGVAGTMPLRDKAQFLTGAILVSCVWFFGLVYGSGILLPLFRNPRAWRILEFMIGCTMWWISFELVRFTVFLL